jgi:predicted transcriptional regulator
VSAEQGQPAVSQQLRSTRNSEEISDLVAPMEEAAGEVRSAIERQVREILGEAERAAARVERDAAQKAREIEREAEQCANRTNVEAMERAARLLESIEFLDGLLQNMLTGLRRELDSLPTELVQGRHAGDQTPELAAPSGVDEEGVVESTADEIAQSSTHVQSMVYSSLTDMARKGADRDEAERFLRRLRLEDHIQVLDHIYHSPPEPRAGLLKRWRKE